MPDAQRATVLSGLADVYAALHMTAFHPSLSEGKREQNGEMLRQISQLIDRVYRDRHGSQE